MPKKSPASTPEPTNLPEGPRVNLSVSFTLEERFIAPPFKMEGDEEEQSSIDGVYFQFDMETPFNFSSKSDPLSTALPEAAAEGDAAPEPVDWPQTVTWSHAEEVSVTEEHSQVDLLQRCCRIATFNQTGDEELAATTLDLSEVLMGVKFFSHRFEIPDLGRVVVTLSLDHAWLDEKLAQTLMPMSVTIQSAEALPKDPHSYTKLQGAFQPVRCEYQLFGDQPLVSTQALPHSKKVRFKHVHVFHASAFSSPAALRRVLEQGFTVRVHDRQYEDESKRPERPPSPSGEEAEAAAAAAAAAEEEPADFPGLEPAPLSHKHCGEARVQLKGLLARTVSVLGGVSADIESRTVKERANVFLVVNPEPRAPSPLSAIPNYMEATSTVSVKVSTGFPMALLEEPAAPKNSIDQLFTGPFVRQFYAFKYKDVEFFKRLTGAIHAINARSLGLKAEHKLDVCAVKPAQELITGFQVADGLCRVFFVEGPRAVMQKLSKAVPRDRPNAMDPKDIFKTFRNDDMGFGERLFKRGTMKLPTYRLCDSLTAIMLQPEVAQIIRSKAAAPECIQGLTRLWAVRRCDYLREVARMRLWPSPAEVNSMDNIFGDDVQYEDVMGEQRPAKAAKRSALATLQAEQVADVADAAPGAGWKDGYFQKPTQRWKKWNKTTERTDQLDVQTWNKNGYFSTMLSERRGAAEKDFGATNKENVAMVSGANTALRPPRPDVADLLPDDGSVFLYSTQSLNTAEMQKELIRRKLDKVNDKFFTYSEEFMSLAMCRVNEPALEREAILENQRRWKTKEGFKWPAAKDPREYNVHPKQLSEAAREELTTPWIANVLHPKPQTRDVSWDPNSGKPQWDNIPKQFPYFEKNAEFFNSVFAAAALGLTPEEAEEKLKEEAKAEEVAWRAKLVVDDPVFRVYFRNTMRKKVHPLERLETFLKDEPAKARRALSKKGRGRSAITQAPISMLAGEPYEDPRDFTLDLKAAKGNGVLGHDVPSFNKLTGLNTKASLIPHNIHGRPPRGELSEPERDRGVRTEESRRRILGMGGTIEPIREEERSSVLFGMKMSKGPLPPGFTEVARRGFHLRSATPPSLPPIAGS
jgi:hypothetical protein